MHEIGWGRQSQGKISAASSLFNTFIRNFQRGQHCHPWLHLSVVQRGHYDRSLGKKVSHYRSGEGDGDAVIVQVREPGNVAEKLYFDRQSDLLLRRVTLSQTALGPFPEQTDFADYRPVDGVLFPFAVHRTEINSRWTEKYATIELNTPLDDAIFAKPKPQSH